MINIIIEPLPSITPSLKNECMDETQRALWDPRRSVRNKKERNLLAKKNDSSIRNSFIVVLNCQNKNRLER